MENLLFLTPALILEVAAPAGASETSTKTLDEILKHNSEQNGGSGAPSSLTASRTHMKTTFSDNMENMMFCTPAVILEVAAPAGASETSQKTYVC